MEALLKISVDPKSVDALSKAILAILKSGQDQATMEAALQTLAKGTTIDGTSVSHSTFTGAGLDKDT